MARAEPGWRARACSPGGRAHRGPPHDRTGLQRREQPPPFEPRSPPVPVPPALRGAGRDLDQLRAASVTLQPAAGNRRRRCVPRQACACPRRSRAARIGGHQRALRRRRAPARAAAGAAAADSPPDPLPTGLRGRRTRAPAAASRAPGCPADRRAPTRRRAPLRCRAAGSRPPWPSPRRVRRSSARGGRSCREAITMVSAMSVRPRTSSTLTLTAFMSSSAARYGGAATARRAPPSGRRRVRVVMCLSEFSWRNLAAVMPASCRAA